MNTFLYYTAQDILNKYGTDLSHIAVVFPNKRASLFLNQYLARLAGKPVWSPNYITISELFRHYSSLTVGDPLKLISVLHKVFIACTGFDDTLDKFYGWGELMISDFDDIDKNMADANKVFANVRNIHELDDVSYLTQEQKDILKKFFANFSDDQETVLKKRFLQLWCKFKDIYTQFNVLLRQEGIAYEGALYRDVASAKDLDFQYDQYLFVGFNVLQKVEQLLFNRLMKAGKAKFYWDFDNTYMPSPRQIIEKEAGHYVSMYLSQFPNELESSNDLIYNNFDKGKAITIGSASTEDIQARYINKWLNTNKRLEEGNRTAIVMCNEGLLPTVIHCLPERIKAVNITTGFPLSHVPISSLVNKVVELHSTGYSKKTNCYRLHFINTVFRHPYAKYISSECYELQTRLNKALKYYSERKDLCLDEGLTELFESIEGATSIEKTERLNSLLINVVKRIAKQGKDDKDPLFQESLFRMYTLLNRLAGLIASGDLNIDTITYTRLLSQLIDSTSIPYHGEPAEGIQVMGVLETRNLDFDHILILSCNEGNMPKGVNDSSFIPHSIRKAYGLTTIDNKVAIYSYYFHSMIQRASDVTILYNSSTEDGHTGEMSRFMLQLLVESKRPVHKIRLFASNTLSAQSTTTITKTESVMKKLYEIEKISPTAINCYMRCQLRFFYNYIAGIKDDNETDEDEIDNKLFGDIFHQAAEYFYREHIGIGQMVTKEALEQFINHPELLLTIVDKAFCKLLFNRPYDSSKIPDYNGLQLLNREVILTYLVQLLKIDARMAPFKIVNLENDEYCSIKFSNSQGERTIKIGGRIDRLDEKDGQVRVVDYKTSSKNVEPISTIDDIFDCNNIVKKHTDYYLQAILYSIIVSNIIGKVRKVSPALLFIQKAGAPNYDPILKINKESIEDIRKYYDDFKRNLINVLQEIYEPSIPFKPVDKDEICATCPYIELCRKTIIKKR